MSGQKKPECQPCTAGGRRGYCASGRCYCGHPECHAYASWSPLPNLAGETPAPAPAPARTSSWDDRQEDTWIDKL